MRRESPGRRPTPRASTARPGRSRIGADAWLAIVLALATLAVYAQVLDHEFLNYDDDEYVTENPMVRSGLTVESAVWAFTSTHSATWHPLTGLSHMLDVELFGMHAGAHLAVNVLLHATAALLLSSVLRTMTGARWRSAWVAALFALHPLRVESVAWISERKDVLSAALAMATLWCYVRYVRAPSRWRYLAVVAVFALGLMAKPMLVTLPFVLVLLDLWPLRRLPAGAGAARARALAALVIEKLPLFALAAAVSAVTVVVQSRAGAVASLEDAPLRLRIANACVAYMTYLRKTFWPIDLAVFYPLVPVPGWRVAAAAALLLGVTAIVVAEWRRRPYLLVGWLWYLGTLVPVIGLVRQGGQAMADRFTYLPHVGLFVMLAWGAAELAGERGRAALTAAAVATVVGCALLTARQVAYWRSSEVLFRHALTVTDDNYIAHTNLGAALVARGAHDEAMAHYLEALRINPGYAKVHLNVGAMLAERGDADTAIAHYREALRVDPRFAMAEYNWGLLLAERGDLAAAVAHYERALAYAPRYAKAHHNLGAALAAQGKVQEAIAHYEQALRLAPDLTATHNNLGVALEDAGRSDEALVHYAAAVRLAPDDPRGRYNLGSALAARGRDDEAIAEYRAAVRLGRDLPEPRYALAAALAKRGSVREAVAEYREALRLRPDWPETAHALAWILATADDVSLRDGAQAVALAEQVRSQSAGDDARILNTLAAAYAEAGRLRDAADAAERALALARAAGDTALSMDIEMRLGRYRAAPAAPEATPRSSSVAGGRSAHA